MTHTEQTPVTQPPMLTSAENKELKTKARELMANDPELARLKELVRATTQQLHERQDALVAQAKQVLGLPVPSTSLYEILLWEAQQGIH